MKILSRALIGFLFLVVSKTGLAQVTPFVSRVSFDAAFPNAAIENWEYPTGTLFPSGGSLGGISYATSDGDPLVVTGAFLSSSGFRTLSRVPGGISPVVATTFTFAAPVSAFGIDINITAFNSGEYSATTDRGDVILSVYDPIPKGTRNFGHFIGFSSSTPFSSVTISAMSLNYAYALDTLRYVPAPSQTAVPEGSTISMAAGMVLCVTLALYKRRNSRPAGGRG
jgi:hypothetical protein